MSKYELVYIVAPNVGHDELESVNKEVKNFFVKTIEFKELGIKNFTDPIQKNDKGYYFVLQGNAEKEQIKNLEEFLNISKVIIRSLLTNTDKEKNRTTIISQATNTKRINTEKKEATE